MDGGLRHCSADSSHLHCLLSDSCSSSRGFATRFLQTPPRDGCPCVSLVLHLHQVGQGTCTPKLRNMPGKPKKEAPEANCPGASEETSLTHPRSDYPSDGCVPAEPSSVSPDEPTLSPKTSLNTGAMPRKIPGVRGLAPEYTGINC